jgi:hypothetical protein
VSRTLPEIISDAEQLRHFRQVGISEQHRFQRLDK